MFSYQFPGVAQKHEAPSFYIRGLVALTDADWWLRPSDRFALAYVATCMQNRRIRDGHRDIGWILSGSTVTYNPTGSLMEPGFLAIHCENDSDELLHWRVRLHIGQCEVWLSRAGRLRLQRMVAEFRSEAGVPIT